MKVYVVTAYKPMGAETYVTVKASRKEAEKVIRAKFPNAKLCDGDFSSRKDYECHDKMGNISFMSIQEEAI